MNENKFERGDKIEIDGNLLLYIEPAFYYSGGRLTSMVSGYYYCKDIETGKPTFVPEYAIQRAQKSMGTTSFRLAMHTHRYQIYENDMLVAGVIPDRKTAEAIKLALETQRRLEGYTVISDKEM